MSWNGVTQEEAEKRMESKRYLRVNGFTSSLLNEASTNELERMVKILKGKQNVTVA